MKLNRRKFLTIGGLSLLGYSIVDGFFIGPDWLDVTYHIQGDRSRSKFMRIVQVSDLHLRKTKPIYEEITGLLNTLQPDFILFTGDMIDRNQNFHLFEEMYLRINQKSIKLGIMGNWEWWSFTNTGKLRDLFEQNNGIFLINESKQFSHNGIKVIFTGLDDLIGGEPDEEAAFAQSAESDYHFVLAHCPGHIHPINEQCRLNNIPIDTVFSGHTHGGQVQVFGFAPVLPPGSGKFVSGWYIVHGTKMFISRGIGMTRIPIRLNARPEIAVFDYFR